MNDEIIAKLEAKIDKLQKDVDKILELLQASEPTQSPFYNKNRGLYHYKQVDKKEG